MHSSRMRTVRCSDHLGRGVCPAGVGCLPRGESARPPPVLTESETDVKTLPCRNYIADGNNGINTLPALIQVWTRTRIPNQMATLYYAEHVHITQTWTQIPTPYFNIGQESKSESVPVCDSRCLNHNVQYITVIVLIR